MTTWVESAVAHAATLTAAASVMNDMEIVDLTDSNSSVTIRPETIRNIALWLTEVRNATITRQSLSAGGTVL